MGTVWIGHAPINKGSFERPFKEAFSILKIFYED